MKNILKTQPAMIKINVRQSLIGLFFIAANAFAQDDKPVHVSVEARADFQQESIDGTKQTENSGFKGNILNVIMHGQLTPKFSYMYRQRLNGINKDHSFFDATDWLYLSYQANRHWSFTVGKWAVLVGGWEFDPAPIDVFQLFEFCYTFPCYSWGVWAGYETTDKKDKFYFQVVESPFQRVCPKQPDGRGDMYAYNLIWYGKHGFYASDWSVNMLEYAPHKYINYISLGNRFHIADNLRVDVDVMNRASSGQRFLFQDCSVTARVDYQPVREVNVWAKASYDVNQTGTAADLSLYDGTEITRLGAGVEYFPLKNNKVRLHANYSYAFGKNTNPCGFVKDKQSMVDLGVTWRVNVLPTRQ